MSDLCQLLRVTGAVFAQQDPDAAHMHDGGLSGKGLQLSIEKSVFTRLRIAMTEDEGQVTACPAQGNCGFRFDAPDAEYRLLPRRDATLV